MNEHAVAADQITKATDGLTRMILAVSRAMSEQTTATNEVATAVASMRKESDQAARALVEQSRAMKDVVGDSQNITRQLNLVAGANRQHSSLVSRAITRLKDVRTAVESNARAARDAHGSTGELTRHVEALSGALGRRRNGSNGHP